MFTQSAELYDAVYASKDYGEEVQRLEALIRQHRNSPGNRLLDVGCGTGGHLVHLRQRYAVEGLDLDEGMLAVARRRLPGVPFHHGDMLDFDLGSRYDVVVCLFSAIGYASTLPQMRQAVATMAGHLLPGGVLAIEPWLPPETWRPGLPHAVFVDRPDLKVARMNVSAPAVDNISVLDFHYMVADASGVREFTERHALGLFSHEQYLKAFAAAGLTVRHEAEGLTGRGLYLGVAAGVPPASKSEEG